MGVGMRRVGSGLMVLAMVGALTTTAQAAASAPRHEYLVFYAPGGQAAAEKAVKAGGGSVLSVERRLGYVLIRADRGFADRIAEGGSIVGVTSDRVIGATSAARFNAFKGFTGFSGFNGSTAARLPDLGSQLAKGEPL